MSWFLRQWGKKHPRTVGHAPSSAATLCDYGILPFGPRHSGWPSGQNRITGDPGFPTGLRRAGCVAALCTATRPFDRSFYCRSRLSDTNVRTFRRNRGKRPANVRQSTRPGGRFSGRTDPYTPHPGLRARVRRARAYEPPLRGGGPNPSMRRRTRCPPTP
ncbi:hypothetical protein E6R62_21055 [Streptomyces sp. A1136]|nr:hypothetical protein E6R62_21055 [Streptomyces sp. A1136]